MTCLRYVGRLAVLALLTPAVPPPAHADVLSTVVTSVRLAPVLSITTPTSVALGSAPPGGTISSAHLGSVKVSASNASNWTATVSATNFTSGGSTITNGRVSYWSGTATATSGNVGTLTPGQPTSSAAQTLDATRTAFSRLGTPTSHTVTWNPSLIVSVPLTAVAGTYTGTVTHSVA